MSICKRNILLIFGYCLIIVLLFLPIQKKFYSSSEELYFSKIRVTFLPFFFKELIKYEKFKTWNQSIDLKHKEKINDFLGDLIRKKEKEYWEKEYKEWNTASKLEFSKLLLLEKYKAEGVDEEKEILIDEVKEFVEKLNKNKQEEFKNIFGDYSYYYKLRVELYVILISIIIFAAGFAYILFCVVLRKSEKRGEKFSKEE